MRIFHKKTDQNQYFLRKHYKLLLWLFLSLYLFFSSPSSFFLPTPSLDKTTLLSFESTPRAALVDHNDGPRPNKHSPIKIYVYDLPSRFNSDWLANPRCGSHLFAAEVAVHEALLASGDRFRALDPYEADFFFVPVYVSCNFSTVNGFPSLTHARSLIADSIAYVSSRYPFWNRTRGGDHIFVASHDYGACFHAMEDVAIADGIPGFLRRSILLQTFGVTSPHRCQEAEHVVIPPYVPPEILQSPPPEKAKRDIFVFFRGKMPRKPPSPTTPTESGGVSATDTATKEQSNAPPDQTKESGSRDGDDVFSDSDNESSKNRRAKAMGDGVDPSAEDKQSQKVAVQGETSNLVHGIQQVSLKKEGDTKPPSAFETKSESKTKSSSVLEAPEVGSTGMSEFKAIAADASVFSFGDEDDYESE